MVERIDGYAHYLPPSFRDEMLDSFPSDELRDLEDATHMWDVESRLDDLDHNGIDRQVVSLARSSIWPGIGREHSLPLTELANDGVREICDEYDRFIPVATLPFLTGEYLEELDRCIEQLDMAGVQIFSNVAGRPLDDPEFRPFFERVEEHGVPIWLHPQLHDWYDWAPEYGNHKIYGWPFDTTLALSRLVYGGVMEAYDLDIVTHHMGGMVPFFPQRLRTFDEASGNAERAGLSRPLLDYFKEFYADTVSNGDVPSLECANRFYGSDQMVFATDYPFGPDRGQTWLEGGVRAVEEMDVSEADREAIFGGNLRSLL